MKLIAWKARVPSVLAAFLFASVLAGAPPAQAAFGSRATEVIHGYGGAERAIPYGKHRFLAILGSSLSHGIVRLRNNGSVDRSFGERGRVAIATTAAAVTADGKILVLGRPDGGGNPTVTRLLPDGSVDTRFGHEGSRAVDLGGRYENGSAIAVDARGRILVAGTSTSTRIERGPSFAAIVMTRLRPGGALDRSFGSGGRVVLTSEAEYAITALAEGPKGSIFGLAPSAGTGEVFELRPDGTPDARFGNRGKLTLQEAKAKLDIGYLGLVESIAVTRQGEPVVAGTIQFAVNGGLRYRAVALRLHADGSLDTRYGTGGLAKGGVGAWFFAGAMLFQPSGRVVLAGQSQLPAGHNSAFAAIAFNPRGTLDRTFGHRGKLRLGIDHSWVIGSAIVQRPHRQAILVGSATAEEGHPDAQRGLALARIGLFNRHGR